MERPATSHLIVVKRILRYVKGTKDLGILYDTKQNISSMCMATLIQIGVMIKGIERVQHHMCSYMEMHQLHGIQTSK